MSGLLATANPRRIKAAHRRRRKVAWGPIVQRYYDPAIGRFLSVDPVTADGNSGGNFNRYWYADNNPYRFTDPDGRRPHDGGSLCSEVHQCESGSWSEDDDSEEQCDEQCVIEQEYRSTFRAPVQHAKNVAQGLLDVVGTALEEGYKWWLMGAAGKLAGGIFVYRAVDDGKVIYVGITNNLARRGAEHLRTKGIDIEKLLVVGSRRDAKAVEQALIEVHRLGKSGGTLQNRINSIAFNNPAYAVQVQRGFNILKGIGYAGN